jgi:hypothetical protein
MRIRFLRLGDGRPPHNGREGAPMGDKGGKKDKEKSKQQEVKKQEQKKQDQARPRTASLTDRSRQQFFRCRQ